MHLQENLRAVSALHQAEANTLITQHNLLMYQLEQARASLATRLQASGFAWHQGSILGRSYFHRSVCSAFMPAGLIGAMSLALL